MKCISSRENIPAFKGYGVLSQLENGVGWVPLFISQAKKVRFPKTPPGIRIS